MKKRVRLKSPRNRRSKPRNAGHANKIAIAVREKILEGIERTIHLIGLVPSDRLDWFPTTSSFSSGRSLALGHLLGHLLDSAAGFCAVLFAAYPLKLKEFAALRDLQVNHSCQPSEAVTRLREYSAFISRGFEYCNDKDLGRAVPTIFVPSGEPLITLLLGNFEHLSNHKYQLFFYLRQFGVRVDSSDLYRFRDDSKSKTRA